MTAATKTPLTLVQCLVKILLGEQIPADNLNGHNEHFYKPLHVIWQQGSAPAVKRAILAQNNPKLKEALAEAEAIIAGNTSAKTSENGFGQKSNATPAGDLEDCPELPAHLALTPPPFPLKDSYITYSKAISPEGYEDFHATCFWVLLSIIAARRIAVNLAKLVYTALMVTLVARTTLIAKTTTTDVVRNVLHACDLSWLLSARKPTPQKLIADMAGRIPDDYDELDPEAQTYILRRLATSGQRGWIYPEVGKLVAAIQKPGSYLSELNDLLLQFADNQEILDQATIGRGTETIERPYLTFLGSMTPPSIKAYALTGSEIWNDGLFGRMVFSCPPQHLVLDEPWGLDFVPVPPELVETLTGWNNRLVEPTIDIITEQIKGKGKKHALQWVTKPQLKKLSMDKRAYQAWIDYRSWLKKAVANFAPVTDFDATYGRLANTALAIAALAASIEDSNTIQIGHWALGQAQAEEWRNGVHRFHAQVNSQERTADRIEKLIVEHITNNGKTTIRDMRRTYRPLQKFEPQRVTDVADYLGKNGILSRKQEGKTIFYDLASRAKKSSAKEEETKR